MSQTIENLIDESTYRLMVRTLSERSLKEYICRAWHVVEPRYGLNWNWHHDGLCMHLEALRAGDLGRMQILANVPPGTSKSLFFNVFFPTWVWATEPDTRWMFATYSSHLSTRDSLARRKLICSGWFQEFWPLSLDDENRKTLFRSSQGGWMFATSIGGAGLGEHPDYLIVDDPSHVQQSLSSEQSKMAIEWWTGTASTRGIIRNAKRAVIMQRLSEGDLSAQILEHERERTVHLCLPMWFEPDRMIDTPLGWNDPRDEEGQLLWPEMYDEATARMMERQLNELYPTMAAGQLQQRPSPLKGSVFNTDWFEVVDQVPYEVADQVAVGNGDHVMSEV